MIFRRPMTARLNADDEASVRIMLVFDTEDPYFIEVEFPGMLDENEDEDDDEEIVWTLGRREIYEAVYNNWPSGVGDIIMIRFKDTLRVYLKNELGQKCTLDLNLQRVRNFIDTTYRSVTHGEEEQMLYNEIGDIEKWM